MPGTITKTVRGRKYTYFEYFEDGRTVQKYCGPSGSARSKSTALRMEYQLLKDRRDKMHDRMREIQTELRNVI